MTLEYKLEKIKRIKEAKAHVAEMRSKYAKEIKHSIKTAEIWYVDEYDKRFKSITTKLPFKYNYGRSYLTASDLGIETCIEVNLDLDKQRKYKSCIVTSGNLYRPGVEYMAGEESQEASLCAISTLYPVLAGCTEFYCRTNQFRKEAVKRGSFPYKMWFLYLHDIIFIDRYGFKHICDVLLAPPTYIKRISSERNFRTETYGNSQLYVRCMRDILIFHKIDAVHLGICGIKTSDYSNGEKWMPRIYAEFFYTDLTTLKRVYFYTPASIIESHLRYEMGKKQMVYHNKIASKQANISLNKILRQIYFQTRMPDVLPPDKRAEVDKFVDEYNLFLRSKDVLACDTVRIVAEILRDMHLEKNV